MRWTMFIRRLGIASSLLSLALVAGCARLGAPAATTAPPVTEPTDTADTAQPSDRPNSDEDCLDVTIHVSRIDPTMQAVALTYPVIVVGTFERYDVARWSTSDGERPATLAEGNDPHIYRPAVLNVERDLRGTASQAATITAAVDGGEVGCDRFSYDIAPQLEPNARYVFIIGEGVDTNARPSGLRIAEAWPIDADDMVATQLDGVVPLSEFEQVLVENPAEVEPPKAP